MKNVLNFSTIKNPNCHQGFHFKILLTKYTDLMIASEIPTTFKFCNFKSTTDGLWTVIYFEKGFKVIYLTAILPDGKGRCSQRYFSINLEKVSNHPIHRTETLAC